MAEYTRWWMPSPDRKDWKKRRIPLLNERQERVLRTAIKRLEDLCDTSPKSMCGVENAAKKECRVYVETWIIPQLQFLLDHAEYELAWQKWSEE